MLIDHTRLTPAELVVLLPHRLVQVDWLSHTQAGARTVFFLYEHFHGGWAIGLVSGRAYSGELFPDTVFLAEARDEQLDAAGALALFEDTLTQALEAGSGRIRCKDLTSLPPDVERALLLKWTDASPTLPELAQHHALCRQLFQAVRQAAGAQPLSPEEAQLTDWLAGLHQRPRVGAPRPLLGLPGEARLWAWLLCEAGRSQQDGAPDALGVLKDEGSEALCSLLEPEALARVGGWFDQARQNLQGPMPRHTLADMVQSSLAPYAGQVLEQWAARPAIRPARPVRSIAPAA